MSFDSYTKLVSHFNGVDGATTYTAETGQTITFVGTAQLDTAQQKFGSASLLLDGNSDYVTVPDHADWDFGTGDFTIDTWVRFATVATGGIWQQRVDANTNISFFYNHPDTKAYFTVAVAAADVIYFSYAFVPSANTWYHLAIVRNGTTEATWHAFVDGVEKTKTLSFGSYNCTMPDIAADAFIGLYATSYLNGWIDEPRISKGIARWTANFTPPTSEYGSILVPAQTILL